jgi:hypothetical protein
MHSILTSFNTNTVTVLRFAVQLFDLILSLSSIIKDNYSYILLICFAVDQAFDVLKKRGAWIHCDKQ